MREWVGRYEKRTEPFVHYDGFTLLFDEAKGFMLWKAEGDTFWINHTSTSDMRWMHERARELARAHGCRRMRTYTMRSPKAYARATGAHLDVGGSRVADGRFYWLLEEELR